MRRFRLADRILIVAVLGTLGVLTAWLHWPAPAQDKPDQDSRPVNPEPVVSPERRFNYEVVDFTVTNAAATPHELTARAEFRLYAYTGPGAGVQEVTALLPEHGLSAELVDMDGNGLWRGTLKAPKLPVDTDIPVRLEAKAGAAAVETGDWQLKIPAPLVYAVKFWREPSGPVKPGEPLTFKLQLNQVAKVWAVAPVQGDSKAINIAFSSVNHSLLARNNRCTDLYTNEWLWKDGVCPEPAIEHMVTTMFECGGRIKRRFELQGEPLVLDYQPVGITGISFNPAPPLIRGVDVEATVTTSRPVSEGEIVVLLSEHKEAVLQGDGCSWRGKVLCGWQPDDWDDPEPQLTCSVFYKLNGITLESYFPTVPLAPLPEVKLASFRQIPLAPANGAVPIDLEVVLDPPVRYGNMTIYIGSPATEADPSQYEQSCILYPDEAGIWKGRITAWDQYGNWGPVYIVYRIFRDTGKVKLAYKAEYHPGDFIVEPPPS